MNTKESDFVNRDRFEQPNKTTQRPKMDIAEIHAMMIWSELSMACEKKVQFQKSHEEPLLCTHKPNPWFAGCLVMQHVKFLSQSS